MAKRVTYQLSLHHLSNQSPVFNRLQAVNERLFDKPMGLYAHNDSLYMACRYQLWQLENRLAAGETHQGGDRLYVPSTAYTSGDLNVHDVVLDKHQKLLFINTDFSRVDMG